MALCIFFCAPIIINVILFFDTEPADKIGLVYTLGTLYFLVSFMTLTCMYSTVTLNFVWNFYKYHRMEFHKHIKRIGILYTATILSSLYGIFYISSMFYLLLCVNNGFTQSGNGAFLEWVEVFLDKDMSNGMCEPIVQTYTRVIESERILQTLYMSLNLSILIPVFTFLLLDKPHDCFVCLGKDPDRIYSIF